MAAQAASTVGLVSRQDCHRFSSTFIISRCGDIAHCLVPGDADRLVSRMANEVSTSCRSNVSSDWPDGTINSMSNQNNNVNKGIEVE